MAKPDGVTITFEGYLCTPEFKFERNTGLEPDFGFVHVLREEFQFYRLEEVGSFSESAQRVTTREKGATADPKIGFQTQGGLVFTEIAGGKEYTVRFSNVLVDDRAIEQVIANDDDSDVVRVQLTDVRKLWRDRGVVFAWINVPKQGDQQPGKDVDLPGRTVDFSTGTTDKSLLPPGSAPGSPKTISGAEAAGLPTFIDGSLDGSKPWTLIRVLEAYIIPNLVGRPTLKRMPDDLRESIVAPKYWDGVRTIKAFRELLDEFRLVFALNPDSSFSLWKEDEGDLMDESFAKIPDDPSGPDVDDRVSNKRKLLGHAMVPPSVLVLGPPILDTQRISGLEPVGEIGGKIVPLELALKNINLNMDQAKVFAFATDSERAAFFKVDADGIERFRRWAFKWYRLPGGPAVHGDKLPLQDRGRCDEIGVTLPIRVWSEALQIVNSVSLIRDKLGVGDSKTTGSKALDALLKSKVANYRVIVNLPFAEATSGYRIDRENGVVMFDAIQGVVSSSSAEFAKTQNPKAPIPTGFNAGGTGGGEGVTPGESFLARPANVQIEFGFFRKPSRTSNVSVEHRYYSFWIREAGGQGEKPKVRQLPRFAGDATPFVINDDALQQVISTKGETNKIPLDALAEKQARKVLEQPPVTEGGVVRIHRPVALINTGRVRSITWGMTAGYPSGLVPFVEAHVGMIAPTAPPQNPRTLARSGPDTAKGSVIAPRGLSR